MTLQCIKPISVTNGLPSIAIPLTFVLLVNAVKDAIEDVKRKKSDNMENRQLTSIARTKLSVDDKKNRSLELELQADPYDQLQAANDRMKRNDQGLLTSDAIGRKSTLRHSANRDLYQDEISDQQSMTSVSCRIMTQLTPMGLPTSSWKNKLSSMHWQDVQPGDLIVLFPNDAVPADGIVLATSDTRGTVFIETSSLDGETSLKIKKPLAKTNLLVNERSSGLEDVLLKCALLAASVELEAPHADLTKFRGTCHLGKGTFPQEIWSKLEDIESGVELEGVISVPATIDNVLLRGSRICHTEWTVMLTAYTGDETKIRLNSITPAKKVSKLEKRTHKLVILMFIIMVTLCAVASAYTVWYKHSPHYAAYAYSGFRFRLSLFKDMRRSKVISQPSSILADYVLSFFTWMLLLTNLVPISLVVSMGLVRSFQAWHMSRDMRMSNDEMEGCVVRTSDLNDELGQVRYIMTDKTGTLTANVMEFCKCAIGPHIFGHKLPKANSGFAVDGVHEPSESSLLPSLLTPHCSCDSPELIGMLRGNYGNAERVKAILFFINLAVNHSALIDEKQKSVYIASSPDEEALLYGASHFGIKFVGRLTDGVLVDILGQTHKIIIEHFYAFNSDRKRSSIVVSFDEEAVLKLQEGSGLSPFLTPLASAEGFTEPVSFQRYVFTKGADTHVLPLCNNPPQLARTNLTAFAEDCLRTLVLAYRKLPEDEYARWKDKINHITRQGGGEEDLMVTADMVEHSLQFQGITGIEDLLAPQVAETIESLLQGGIKIWMLTGDKFETAFNIGLATNLIAPNSHHVVLTADRIDNMETDHLLHVFETLLAILRQRALGGDYEAIKVGGSDLEKLASLNHDPTVGEIPEQVTASEYPPEKRSRLLGSPLSRKVSLLKGTGGLFHRHQGTSSPSITSSKIRASQTTIIWDGIVLRRCLDDPALRPFVFKLSQYCSSGIFCRTSPQDKGDVVRLCRESIKNVTCLAVGDGANDCNMLMAASVGVGIKGREGLQAFNVRITALTTFFQSSDYGLTEFRHLRQLLLVHGRWNYRRLVKMVMHTFYKNFVFCMPTYYFAAFSLWSGQKTFPEYTYQLYNVALTQLPVLCFGIWDQDVKSELSIAFPQLYKWSGILKKRSICHWLICGLWHSICVFFIPTFALTGKKITNIVDYQPNDFGTVANIMFLQVMIIVHGKLFLETMCPNWLIIVSVLLSFLFCFLITFSTSYWPDAFPQTVNSAFRLVTMPMAYILCFITPVIALSVDVVIAVFDRTFKPELHHLMQFLMRFEQDEKRTKRQLMVEAVKQGGPQLLLAMGVRRTSERFAYSVISRTGSNLNAATIKSRLIADSQDEEEISAALQLHDREKSSGGMTAVVLEVLQLKPLLAQIKGGFAFANPDDAAQPIAFGKGSSEVLGSRPSSGSKESPQQEQFKSSAP